MKKFEEKGGARAEKEMKGGPTTRIHHVIDLHVQGLELGGSDPAIAAKLEQILIALAGLKAQQAIQTQEISKMAGELEAVEAEVARNTTVDGSILALVNGLAAQIASMKNDPVRLQALADSLRRDNDAIVAKVREHTPEPEPPPA